MSEVQQCLAVDLADERAILREEIEHCISENTAEMIRSRADTSAETLALLYERGVIMEGELFAIRRYMEQLETYGLKSQKLCRVLQ